MNPRTWDETIAETKKNQETRHKRTFWSSINAIMMRENVTKWEKRGDLTTGWATIGLLHHSERVLMWYNSCLHLSVGQYNSMYRSREILNIVNVIVFDQCCYNEVHDLPSVAIVVMTSAISPRPRMLTLAHPDVDNSQQLTACNCAQLVKKTLLSDGHRHEGEQRCPCTHFGRFPCQPGYLVVGTSSTVNLVGYLCKEHFIRLG